MSDSAWGSRETQYFYALTPEKVLDAVELSLGVRCTGRSLAHASMENRVYEIELDVDEIQPRSYAHQVIAKFYRPGRWTEAQILEEHSYLKALESVEIPVVAPKVFADGRTLHRLADAEIYYAIFPKVGGRSPQELSIEEVTQIGRLLGRMHNVGASLPSQHRLTLNPDVYLQKNLQYLLAEDVIPPHLQTRYIELVQRLTEMTKPMFQSADKILIHGDCHLGNLLQNGSQFFWVDFDDCIRGPAVQDLWLLLPGRDAHAQMLMDHLLEAYEQMRPFPRQTLQLIEGLRSMRMLHFAAWIAHRRTDPHFLRAFPSWGTEHYWQQLYQDLVDQEEWIQKPYFWT